MATQLQELKQQIDCDVPCLRAYDRVDLGMMTAEGDGDVANKIRMVLDLISEINDTAGIEN